jgi:hypothetical protein
MEPNVFLGQPMRGIAGVFVVLRMNITLPII